MEIQKICIECRFWKPEGGVTFPGGLCRRRAPRPSEDGDALWARTSPDDSCGEFELEVRVVDRAEVERRHGTEIRSIREESKNLEPAAEEVAIFRKVVMVWETAVRDADLHDHTKFHYTNHPKRVLRWLEGRYRLPAKRQGDE